MESNTGVVVLQTQTIHFEGQIPQYCQFFDTPKMGPKFHDPYKYLQNPLDSDNSSHPPIQYSMPRHISIHMDSMRPIFPPQVLILRRTTPGKKLNSYPPPAHHAKKPHPAPKKIVRRGYEKSEMKEVDTCRDEKTHDEAFLNKKLCQTNKVG